MNDITQSALYNAATTVQSSVTQPLEPATPTVDVSLQHMKQICRFENNENLFTVGALYGKLRTFDAFLEAFFEGLKSKEEDAQAKAKISHMHKCMQQLWSFFVSSQGKQLTETELCAIMAGYYTSCYEKTK